MSKFILACLIVFAALNNDIKAEEQISCLPAETSQTASPAVAPNIKARFFSTFAIMAIPKLKSLNAQDPGFNKILFRLEGYPTQQEIIMEIKRLAGPNPGQYRLLKNLVLQEDGSFLSNSERIDPLVWSSRGFLPGERVSFRFRTADDSISKEISGILAPATYRDEEGRVTMRAELLSVSPTVYAIDLPALREGEEYELKSTSLGETVKAKPKYSSQSPFHYSPSGGKNPGGVGNLEVRRQSGELYFLELPWGTALDKYLDGKKAYNSYN